MEGTQDAILARLSRRTSSGRYIPAIDGLRFVAIMLVLVFHVSAMLDLILRRATLDPPFGSAGALPGTTLLGRVVGEMKIGVPVFFALSGFVLSLPYISARARGTSMPSLRRYYLRRLTRIEPLYVVVLTLLLIVSLISANSPGFGHYLAGLAYLHGAWFQQVNPYDGVTWSLEVEIQFYILVPLLALALCAGERSARRMTCLILATLAIGAQLAGAFDGTHFSAFVGNFLQFFMIGWLFGAIYVTTWAMRPPQRPHWDVVTVVGWPLLLVGLTTGGTFGVALAPWLILTLFVAAACGPRTSKALSNRWIATIGGMCYSIYLTHYPVMILMRGWIAPVADLPYPVALLSGALIMLPIVLAVGGAFFIAIERPCMDPDWGRRVFKRVGLPRPAYSPGPS